MKDTLLLIPPKVEMLPVNVILFSPKLSVLEVIILNYLFASSIVKNKVVPVEEYKMVTPVQD